MFPWTFSLSRSFASLFRCSFVLPVFRLNVTDCIGFRFLPQLFSPHMHVRAMKRHSSEMTFPGSNDGGGSPRYPTCPKRVPPSNGILKIWVENLPREGGCVSAAFYVAADGIVDDLKAAITGRLSNPRFGLYKKQFRLMQGGQHRPYYEKLSALQCDVPLTFNWTDYSTYSYTPSLEYRL